MSDHLGNSDLVMISAMEWVRARQAALKEPMTADKLTRLAKAEAELQDAVLSAEPSTLDDDE